VNAISYIVFVLEAALFFIIALHLIILCAIFDERNKNNTLSGMPFSVPIGGYVKWVSISGVGSDAGCENSHSACQHGAIGRRSVWSPSVQTGRRASAERKETGHNLFKNIPEAFHITIP